jgi:hypothetical protein
MADSNFGADPARHPIAELGRLIGRTDVHGKSVPTDNRLDEESAPGGFDELPEIARVRLGGLTAVMTMISFLLVSTAGVFGYRSMFGGGSTPATIAHAVKASKESTKIPPASSEMPARITDKEGQVDGAAPTPHVIATIPITTHQGRLSEMDMPATGAFNALVVSNQTTPRKVEGSDPPSTPPVNAAARRIAANRAQLGNVPLESNADSSAAPATPPAFSNGFAVQVASERSESKAQASFRVLQAKYSDQLRGHQPIIRRADLGAAGIYYRALVGPFASPEKAAKLCSRLKAAGGDCIIQRI